MTARGNRVLCRVTVAIMATLLAACDGGPSESEYMAACIKEGETGANKMLRREMGFKSDTGCKCMAKEAASSLSADARQSMILNMQGKMQESRAIMAKMSEADKMAAMNAALELFKKCAGSGR
ncbi:MAG: hypothetical protein ACXW16_00705 [Burkholderiaceae bacterium]